MKRLLTVFVILVILFSCQMNQTKIIEGDLYFKLIDFRFFEAPDSLLTKIATHVKTVNKDTLSDQEKKNYDFAKLMYDEELLRKPFLRLRQDDGKIIIVALDTVDYGKIKGYNYSDLVSENKRIRIKAEVSVLKRDSLRIYKNIKLISIDKIDGKTHWKK